MPFDLPLLAVLAAMLAVGAVLGFIAGRMTAEDREPEIARHKGDVLRLQSKLDQAEKESAAMDHSNRVLAARIEQQAKDYTELEAHATLLGSADMDAAAQVDAMAAELQAAKASADRADEKAATMARKLADMEAKVGAARQVQDDDGPAFIRDQAAKYRVIKAVLSPRDWNGVRKQANAAIQAGKVGALKRFTVIPKPIKTRK